MIKKENKEYKINLNDTVRFRITAAGWQHLIKKHNYLYGKYAASNALPYIKTADGWYEDQLWSFMGHFGDAMQYLTIDCVVDTEIIITKFNQ